MASPTASTSCESLTLTVAHKKQTVSHTIPSSITLEEFCSETLSLESDGLLHKLVTKGRILLVPGPDASRTLSDLSIPNGTKFLMISSPLKDVEKLEAEGAYERRRAATRANTKTVKVRDTTNRTLTPFRFHAITPLPASPVAPFLAERRALLERLAEDAGIKEVMKEREFGVGTLGELHPHVNPTLLGVNENQGQSIRLRLLTDRLDGLRAYTTVRRVLCHELAHNQFGPHDDNFKTLDSAITKRILAVESARCASCHRLGGDLGDHWEPPEHIEAACSTSGAQTPTSGSVGKMQGSRGQVLGGGSSSGAVVREAERRRRAAEAAQRRMSGAARDDNV